ncbi:MAG: hypothetical protein ACFCAD_07865, partial [Pleurocapsa sp.]
ALYIGEFDNNTVVGSETIGGANSLDVFQFSINEAKQFGAALSVMGDGANADLALFDSQGEVLAISQETEIPLDSFGLTLDAVDYYLAVGSIDAVATSYDVALAFDDVTNAIDSGFDSSQAFDL